MTNNQLKSRVRFFAAKTKKATATTPTVTSRRDPNFVDMTDLESDSIGEDFFEFEEELSKMKASNKSSGALASPNIDSKNSK